MHNFSEPIKEEEFFDKGKRIQQNQLTLPHNIFKKNGDPSAPVEEVSSQVTRMIFNLHVNITHQEINEMWPNTQPTVNNFNLNCTHNNFNLHIEQGCTNIPKI